MIELRQDQLIIRFPEVHPAARCTLSFHRTLRIPDDGNVYPLPPGLGCFPLQHVDDYAGTVPRHWLDHGGVFLPLYQSEALWIRFSGHYPFAIKVAAGKINAVTGEGWDNALHRKPQDYLVSRKQPWLDGFCVAKGMVRQFVAMPLGAGYSAEEQLTGEGRVGGIQILAYPMQAEAYRERFERQVGDSLPRRLFFRRASETPREMGLAPGGRLRQEIYQDPYQEDDWDCSVRSRCFVHLLNSHAYRQVTGQAPPTPPITAKDYAQAGLPWFEYYGGDVRSVLDGARRLARLLSPRQKAQAEGRRVADDETVAPGPVVRLGPADPVREADF